MAIIRLSTIGAPADYSESLLPTVCINLGHQIQWVTPKKADILIYGPFFNNSKKSLGWCPKPLRPLILPLVKTSRSDTQGGLNLPITIFQTGENTRYDHISADYSISSDLGVEDHKHFRLPYWYELVDWSKEGIIGNQNPRFGELINLDRLLLPLGSSYLDRNNKAALLSSHLREPRKSLLQALEKVIDVENLEVTLIRQFEVTILAGLKRLNYSKTFLLIYALRMAYTPATILKNS